MHPWVNSSLSSLSSLSLPTTDDIDWDVKDVKGAAKITGVILLSFAFFRLLQYTVRWYLFGKCTFRTFDYFKFGRSRRRRNMAASTELEAVPPNKKWRISNEAVSLIHSVVSGLWAMYSVLYYPKLVSEMNTYSHPVPKFLVYISFGYIIHDLVDLLINERSIRILELLFHHVIVVLAFLTTIVPNLFLGVVILGLLMELNSVFLHSRSLLNLYRQPKTSTAFKFVALLNILTFMVFRMAVTVYLVYWQITNAWQIEWYFTAVTFIVIVSLSITNTVLCYRVLAADGLLGAARQRAPTRTETKTDEDEELDADEEIEFDSDGEEAPQRRHSHTTATQTSDAIVQNGQQPIEVVVHSVQT